MFAQRGIFINDKIRDDVVSYYLRNLFVEDSMVRRSDRLAAKKNNTSYKIPNFTTSHFENSFVTLKMPSGRYCKFSVLKF